MNEIEEFLRRIAEQKMRQTFVGDDDDEIIDAEIVEDDEPVVAEIYRPPEPQGGTVFSHDQQFGQAIDQVDDRMDRHLHEVFEHRLGELGTTTSRAADIELGQESSHESPPAMDLASSLRSPGAVRKAIVLSEILNRPVERW